MATTVPTPVQAQILGRHIWSELMTTDTRAAEAFYDRVIGWTSQPYPESAQPYTQFKQSAGVPIAGLMARPDGMNIPPFWPMSSPFPTFEKPPTPIKSH